MAGSSSKVPGKRSEPSWTATPRRLWSPRCSAAIDVVEVEMASELVRCGFAGEPAVLAGLAVGKETDRHRSGLLRPRGGPRRPFAEEFRRRFPWLACGVDVCIERR